MLFYPPVIRAMRIVEAGGIGDLRGVRILTSDPTGDYLSKDSWFHKLPGGLLGETGPHVIYLSLPFIGDVLEVHAHARKLSSFPWALADDFVVDLVGTKCTSSIRVVHNSDFCANDLDIWGTRGRLKVDLQGMTLHRFRRENRKLPTFARSVMREAGGNVLEMTRNVLQVATHRFKIGHERVIEEFVKSVRHGGKVPVSPESARDTVAVLEQAVKQLESTAVRGEGDH